MNTYNIEISSLAKKSLKNLPKNIQTTISKKIDLLFHFNRDMKNIKMLTGEYKGLFRLRVGDYRIFFQVRNSKLIIVIIDILPRGSSY